MNANLNILTQLSNILNVFYLLHQLLLMSAITPGALPALESLYTQKNRKKIIKSFPFRKNLINLREITNWTHLFVKRLS